MNKNQILGTIETILGSFTGGGLSNNAWKRHLWAIMNVEPKKRRNQYKPIYFFEEDFGDIDQDHDDPMVISTLIHNFLVKWILIDQGSLADILYSHMVEVLGLKRNMYKFYTGMLVGFARGQVQVDGTIMLQLTVGS